MDKNHIRIIRAYDVLTRLQIALREYVEFHQPKRKAKVRK